MIWLTWRQFRVQGWSALVALAAVAIALAVTGPNVATLSRTSGFADCAGDCAERADDYLGQVLTGSTGTLYWAVIGLMFGLPALIGVFWGAPLLARELEAGTHRLVWMQGITRGRWLAVKLLGIGLAAIATAGLFSLAITWWTAPIDRASMNRMFPEIFATRGIVPLGYAAFAFAVGVTSGMLLRRTVPAMAVTLALVVAVQIANPFWIREHLVDGVQVTTPLDASTPKSMRTTSNNEVTVVGRVQAPGAWVVSNDTVTPSGDVFVGRTTDGGPCTPEQPKQTCGEWLAAQQLRQQVSYVPADRFWPLQWTETGLYLALSMALAGFCAWWVRRRVT
jgi:hypothetical protein